MTYAAHWVAHELHQADVDDLMDRLDAPAFWRWAAFLTMRQRGPSAPGDRPGAALDGGRITDPQAMRAALTALGEATMAHKKRAAGA